MPSVRAGRRRVHRHHPLCSALPALIVELRTARAELVPLVAAVEFALARFCDPHALDTDPAAVRLKKLCEAALALARNKTLNGG